MEDYGDLYNDITLRRQYRADTSSLALLSLTMVKSQEVFTN